LDPTCNLQPATFNLQPSTKKISQIEICILAGGLSHRMGRDKARLRLGRRTLLGWVLAAAKTTSLPARIIRRDSIPRCGPLGGIYTALNTTKADAFVFLACDMPFITPELIRLLIEKLAPDRTGVFVRSKAEVGFPFILRRQTLPTVTGQIERHQFSLQLLARVLKAKTLTLPRAWASQLRNINTKEDFFIARRRGLC
jgi:molybdopterin-guanine dinucleotide biosynthesis protein A